MSLKNFIGRLRKRILDRRAPTKPRASQRLRVRRLEDRKLLDAGFAGFAIDAGILTLDCFASGDTLTADGDLSAGNGVFNLLNGTWDNSSVGPGFALSNGDQTLTVALGAGMVTELNIDGTATPAGQLATVASTTGLTVGTLAIADVDDADFSGGVNDVDSLAVTTVNGIQLSDVDDVSITTLTATADASIESVAGDIVDSPGATINIGGNADFEALNITLGDDGADSTNFGSLTFASTFSVSIIEDSATELSGTNTAGTLTLTSSGALTNAAAATLDVTGNADLTADSINIQDTGGRIVNFGSVQFSADGDVTLQENGSLHISADSQSASGNITLNAGGDLTMAGGSSLTGGDINLTANETATDAGDIGSTANPFTIDGTTVETFSNGDQHLGGSGTISAFDLDSIDNVDVPAGIDGLGNGTITLHSGIFELDAPYSVVGDLVVESSAVITGTGDIGDVTFATGSGLNVDIDGLTADTEYDQLNANGDIMLAGSLTVAESIKPAHGTTFTIVENTGATTTTTGTFDGLAEGASFTAANGQRFTISYTGGSGNDVVLTAQTPVYDLSSATYPHDENAASGLATLKVERTGDTSVASSVNLMVTAGTATAGADFAAGPRTVEFLAGESTKDFTIAVVDDAIVEADETINVALIAPKTGGLLGTTTAAVLTVTDPDTATVTLSGATVTANEGNSGTASLTFDVTLNAAVDGGFSVGYFTNNGSAIAGSDYIDNDGTLAFTGNANEVRTVTVQVNGDAIVEADETLNVTLGASASGSVDNAAITVNGTAVTGTISNDDSATLTLSTANASITETDSGTTTYDFDVSLSAAVQGGLTVAYSAAGSGTNPATASDDFTPAGSSLSFDGTVGETETISISVAGEFLFEADETFDVTLGAITPTDAGINAATFISTTGSPVTGTITNDDTPTLIQLDVMTGDLTISDQVIGGQDDNLTISSDGAGNVVVTSTSMNLGTGSAAASNSLSFAVTGAIIINGGDGDDLVTVDFSNGDPIAGGLTFNGEGQATAVGDGLVVIGSGTQNATYTPDATAFGTGEVTVDGSVITFTGLEPVDITGMANAVLTLPGADDILAITQGTDFATGTSTALVVSGTSAGVAIEAAAFWNNTNLTINTSTTDGSDAITFAGPTDAAAHANTNLSVITGAGTDTVTLNGNVVQSGNLTLTTVDVVLAANSELDADNIAVTGDIGDGAGAFTLTLDGATSVDVSGTIDTQNLTTQTAATIGSVDIDGNLDVSGGALTTDTGGIEAAGDATVSSNLQSTTLVDIDGNTSLGANITAAAGSILLGSGPGNAVTLAADAVLTATADVNVSGNVTGPFSIDLAGATGNDVSGTIGNDVVNLDISAGNLTAGTIDITGDLTSDAGLNVETDTGAINVDGNLATGGTLTAETGVDIGGASSLGGDVTAEAGSIVLGDNVMLTANALLTATAMVNVTGNVTGPFSIDLAGATGNDVSGTIGNDVVNLDVSAGNLTAGTVDIAGNLTSDAGLNVETNTGAINVDGNLATGGTLTAETGVDIGGTSSLGGDVTAQSGSIAFGDDVTLTANATIDSSGGNGDVDFTGNVQGDQLLTIAAGAGTVDFLSTVGSGTALSGLLVTSAGTLNFNNTVAVDDEGIDITAGVVSVANTVSTTSGGNVEVTNSGLLTIAAAADMNLDGSFTANGTGGISTAGDITTTGDDITFADAVTMAGDVALNSGAAGGNVNFDAAGGTVDGAHKLTITAGTGNVEFDAVVGGTAALTEVDIVSASAVNFDAAVNAATVSADASTIDGTGLITAATIDLDATSGVGNSSGINTAATNIAVDTTTGNINVDNSSAASTSVTSLTTGDGVVSFDQTGGGDLVLSGPVSSGDPANGGSISITSSAALTVAAAATVSSAAGTGGALTISGATVAGPIIAGAGNISLVGASDDLIISNNLTSSSTMQLSAARDVIISGAVSTTDGAGIVVSADSNLGADSGVGGHGGVRIAAAGQLNAAGDVTISGSDLHATGGDVDAIVIESDGANNQVIAGGNISIAPTTNVATAAATIINGGVETTGATSTVSISADGNVEFGADGDVAALGGNVTITADTAAGTNGGQVTMADGAQVIATTGIITVSADGNVSVGQLSNTTTIHVTSDSGAITDATAAESANITAQSAALSAATGVGSDANDINTALETVAATTESGDIHISDADALTIGTVSGISGLTIADVDADDSLADNITVETNGVLTVAEAVTNSDGGNVTLTTNGAASNLLVQADIVVTGSNATLDNNGNIELTSGAAITMDDGTALSTSAGLVEVTAVNDITVSSINTPSGEARLDSTTGAVIDGGDSAVDIIADSASIEASAGIGATNQIDTALSTLAFDNSASGLVNISNTGNLTIGDVNGVAASANNNADAKLTVTGDLEIAQNIALGSGNLLLAVTGDVTQQAGDNITAGGLALMVGGDTTLQNTGNDVTTFAANNGGETFYTDANALTVGEITVDGMPVTGVTTSGDNVKLVTGGDLTISEAIATGAGDLFLAVTGSVTQTAAISGNGLALMVSGITTLTNASNAFTTLAANNGGITRYTDIDALDIGEVAVDGMTATGITTSSDVRLTTGGSLNINEAVAVGAGNLLLDVTGNVAQAAAITGTGLALNVTGTSILTNAANSFTTIATDNGDATEYVDASALEVGSVTVDGSITAGISSSNDNVTLCATSLTLATGIAIGTGTLRMSATAGSITQTGGAIVAQELGAKAATGINLSSAGNDVDEFAADGGTGSITLVDSDGYTLGEVTTAGCFDTTVTGITTDGNFETCVDTGNILLTSAINAGGTVRLEAAAGNVTQTAAGIITADALGVRANDNITLNAAANDVNTFAAESSAGNIDFNDANAVTVSTVSAGTCFTQAEGIATLGGDGNISVQAATDLTVTDAIAADGAGNVTLNAAAGIFENNASVSSATGNIDVDADTVNQNADITTGGAGTIDVTADTTSITMAAGVASTTADGDITYEAATDVTLSQLKTGSGDIDVDALAGTADLNELISSTSGSIDITGDAVTQDADITTAGAGTIDVTADDGDITMADGTTSSTATGAISYDATTDVAISELNSTAGPVNVTATNGDITDNRSGEGAGSENVLGTTATLTASGNIGGADDIDTAVDTLDASSTTAGDIAIAETDAINLADVDTADGSVTIVAGGQITATDIVSTTDTDDNDIQLTSTGGGIEVVSVTAGSGTAADVVLDAQAGDITNSGADPDLVADDLNATASGSITLDTTLNTVTAASTAAGDITLNETDAITLDSITTADGTIEVTAGADIVATSVTANGGAGDSVSLTATTGDVTATSVAAADSVNIDSVAGDVIAISVTADTGNVDIDAQGDVTATSVTATAGNIDITADTGDVLVDTISANGPNPTVTIEATVGSVLDSNNDTAVNINAANGNVVITAGTDIGEGGTSVLKDDATNPLEIDSAIMNLTATGIIAVHQATATVINTLNAGATGTIFLSSDADIDLSGATPTATNLSVRTPTGTITLPNPVDMVTGDLRIEAADVTAAGGIDLTATRLLFKSGQTEEITIHGTGGGTIEFDGQTTDAAANLTVNVDTDMTLTDLDCDEFALDVGSNIAVINATGVTVDQADQTAQPMFDSKIRSGSLVLNGTATYQLANPLNDTDVLAGNNSGTITYRDIDDVTIDTVATPANGNIVGLTSGSSDVLLDIGTTLTINQQLNAGTADARILANGDITQTATGIITANELGIQQNNAAGGDIQLGFNNAIDEVAATNAFSGGMITVQSTRDLTVGTVDTATDAGVTFGMTTGLVSTAGDITVESDMALTLDDVVDAGTADIRLIAQGDIVQDANGTVTANELGIQQSSTAGGNIQLAFDNAIDEVAASNAFDGGIIAIQSTRALEVGSVSEKTDGGVTFTLTDGVVSTNGDILLESEATLTLDTSVNAGTADVRLIADGNITQDVDGLITAGTLGIRQESSAGNIQLGFLNNIDEVAASNVAVGGVVAVQSTRALTVGSIDGQSAGDTTFAAVTGINSNAGDINITAEGDLDVNEDVNAAHDTITDSIDESITLISRNGNFTLADNTIITSDENPAPGVFDDITGDVMTIIAGSSGSNGTVNPGDGTEFRTDGGVAKQIAPRPTAFATPGTVNDAAFVTLADAESMRSNLTFVPGGFLGELDLVFGVAGEENLQLVVDWGAVSQTSLTSSGPAGDATANGSGTLVFDIGDADKTVFYIDQGGERYIVPHVYAISDQITTANDRNGRQFNPGIFGVRFSVAQHSSINIWGSNATDPAGTPDTAPPDFSGVSPAIADANGIAINPAATSLALLSSTDTNNLDTFGQEAAQLPLGNDVQTPNGRPVGLAEWEFIAGPSPGAVPNTPTERSPLEIPLIEAPFVPSVVSDVTGNIEFGAGASSDAAIGTEVYLQIRRYFELDAEAEIVIARISDSEFISNRESFEEFVEENPELQDGSGYEVWLITETSGQRVERPIVKFEITGGRPGPATEQLPDTFEPYQLKELDFEQPDVDGEAVQPAPADGASIDGPSADDATADTKNQPAINTDGEISQATGPDNNDVFSAAAVLLPSLAFTKVARWKRQQSERQAGLTRTARTLRRMEQQSECSGEE